MTQDKGGNASLQWEKGEGWLVFSGGADALGEVRAMALSRMIPDGVIVYIGTSSDSGEDVMEDMNELGATTGFLVNVLMEDDETITESIQDAALVVIPDEVDVRDLQSTLKGAALRAIKAAYQHGAVILAEGQAAAMFGHIYVVEGIGYDGFGWLRGGLIVPDVVSVSDSETALAVLSSGAAALGVGIGVGSALALGPDGAIETWGGRQVTVALGRA